MRGARTALMTAAAAALWLLACAAPAGAAPDASGGPRPAFSGRAPRGVVPGAWVVELAPRLDRQVRARLGRAGVTVARVSRDARWAVVTSSTVPAGLEKDLERVPGVRLAEPLYIARIASTPNDPLLPMQWGVRSIEATRAWDTTTGAGDVTIAIVDTGIDLAHVEFAGRIVGGRLGKGRDFVNADDVAQDDDGHGTHVAGIAAAASDNATGIAGVAPRCSIMPVKVLDAHGEGTSFDVAEGIKWAADEGADVINLSLQFETYPGAVLLNAVRYARAADALVVAAAGNTGQETAYPAAFPGVLGVSAVTTAHAIADFSSRGRGIDLAAPGVWVWSTRLGGGFTPMQGTSMAAPFVSGVAALVRSLDASLSADEVAARLIASAVDLGAPGRDDLYGAGLLNAAGALARTVASVGDDDVPGVLLPSPVHGRLDSADGRDVTAVSLQDAQMLVATLTVAPGARASLRVLGPDVRSVAGPDPPLAQAETSAGVAVVRADTLDAGLHYLDVALLTSDEATYTLEWGVAGDEAADDIPGTLIPASPVTGLLAEGTDDNDVYRVHLTTGQKLGLTLNGSVGTDFDLALYGPSALSIHSSRWLVESNRAMYPDALSYVAKSTGWYYVVIKAYSGAGRYTLMWQREASAPDDDIPGVPLPASPVAEAVSKESDPDDVYWFYLDRGDSVAATLTGPSDSDFDLYLWGAEARHIAAPDVPAVEATSMASGEAITYAAPCAGRYYLHVNAYDGGGDYTLVWRRTRGIDDDDIPRALSESAPLTRTLGVEGDADDLFAVPLEAGQQLSVTLEPVSGLDAGLLVFGPGAVSIQGTEAIASSYWRPGTEHVTLVAPISGMYYLDARRISGEGLYTLDWAVSSATARTSALAMSAGRTGDGSLVSLMATLTADGAPVDGAVIAFEGESDEGWVLVGSARTAPDGSASLTVPAAMTRYRARHSGDASTTAAVSGVGEIAPRAPARVRLDCSPPRPGYRTAFTLTARASDASSGLPASGVLTIERYTSAGWTTVKVSQGATDAVSVSLRIEAAQTYRARFGGSLAHEPAESSHLTVKPYASVTTPIAPAVMYRTKAAPVHGYLKPRHQAGTYPVRIYRWRKTASGWRSYGYVAARASNYSTYSRYAASLRLPYAGTWRLRAYAVADAGHAATWSSGYDYVTVR